MDHAYRVIGGTKSRTLRVLWMLEEIGQPYTHVSSAPRSDDVKSFNPAGKIPVLVSDGVPITDSVAIMTFLADRHDRLTFAPGTLDRAGQDSLTNCILDEFDAVLWTAARHSFVLPEDKRLPAIKDSLKWEFRPRAKQFRLPHGRGWPVLDGPQDHHTRSFVGPLPWVGAEREIPGAG